MCYTLIDKLEKAAAATTDIATVGYQTLFSVLTNEASDATDYTGTKAEADAIVGGTTVNVSDGSNPVALDKQYIKARTQAGTKTAYLEIVLTKPYIASITLPAGLTRTVDLLTLPSNSKA